MKSKLLLLFIIPLIAISLHSVYGKIKEIKRSEVPSEILLLFSRAFPEAEDTMFFIWEKDKQKLYLMDFFVSEIGSKLFFNEEGKIIRYQEEIDYKALPQRIREAALKDYPGAKMLRIDKINVEGILTGYTIVIEKDEKKIDLEFLKDGQKVDLMSIQFVANSNEQ